MLFSPAKTPAASSEPLRLLLTNDLALRIFATISKLRRVRFHQLLVSEPALGRDELKQQLKRLLAEDLVAATEMPVEDCETYYVTRKGLTTERRLRQVQAG